MYDSLAKEVLDAISDLQLKSRLAYIDVQYAQEGWASVYPMDDRPELQKEYQTRYETCIMSYMKLTINAQRLFSCYLILNNYSDNFFVEA